EVASLGGVGVDLGQLRARILAASEEALRKSLLIDWRYEGKDRSLTDATIDVFAERVVDRDQAADLIENTLYAILDLIRYETDLFITYLRRRRRGVLGCDRPSEPTGWLGEARPLLLGLQSGV